MILERGEGREGEREEEKHQFCCLSYVVSGTYPEQGPNLQPRHVP